MQKLTATLLFCLVLAGAGVAAYAAANSDRALRSAIAKHADEIYRDASDPLIGDADGAVPVVVFTDFNCPDCRAAEPAIERLLKEQKDIRLIVKQLPILGPDSEIAARIALAAEAQGKYWPLHRRLFLQRGRITPGRALRVAKTVGADIDELKTQANDDAVTEALLADRELAKQLDVPGVPYILVGDREIAEGGDLYDALSKTADEIRAKGCQAAC